MPNRPVVDRVDAYEVTIPIEAPLRHSYGVHQAFTRTIVEVHLTNGMIGLGETAASSGQILALADSALGLHPTQIGLLRTKVTQRFYWSKNPLLVSALEMAFIDLLGKLLDEPAHSVLGGAVRPDIEMAGYLFYRYSSEASKAVQTPDEMAAHANELVEKYGFRTLKLKGGVQHPSIELETVRKLRAAFPEAKLRFDPNAAWTPSTAIQSAAAFEAIDLEYYEDPAPGMAGMAQVRAHTRMQLATNMCVVDFEDLPGSLATGAVDVILSDPWYWGGATQTQLLAQLCGIHGLSVGMHSGIELGIGMAVMAHTGVTIPNLTMAVDAHYHHLTDDVVVGPKLLPRDGRVAPPDGPGWGVELDFAKVAKYRELFASGAYANVYVTGDSGSGPDPYRPDWFPVMPAW